MNEQSPHAPPSTTQPVPPPPHTTQPVPPSLPLAPPSPPDANGPPQTTKPVPHSLPPAPPPPPDENGTRLRDAFVPPWFGCNNLDSSTPENGLPLGMPYDTQYKWIYTSPSHWKEPPSVIDEDDLNAATQKRIQTSVAAVASFARRKLFTKPPTPVNILKLMWPRNFFCLLADNFQMRDTGFKEEPSFPMWSSFLAVILKGSFYNCCSFRELYDLVEEYGDTTTLMLEATFMAMKRRLSASKTPGDDQRVLTESYELGAGEDRTGDFERWEQLLTNTTAPFLPEKGMHMIDDDHFETQANAGAIATQQNPKKGRAGPLADAACLADLRLISAVSMRRLEESSLISSVRRVLERLESHRKRPSVIFCDRGYSSFPVLAALWAEGVSVFGTGRDYEARTNVHGPFAFKDHRDGITQFTVRAIKPGAITHRRAYMTISGT